jgi:histone H3/H4
MIKSHKFQRPRPFTTMSPTKPAAPAAPANTVDAANTANTADKENKQQNKGPPSAVEFEPPLACVRRILKHTLPSSTNVGKDASAAFARASGIFIIYLTACANDFARENRRQTITANDVLAAIKVSIVI